MDEQLQDIRLQPVDDDSWPPRSRPDSFWGVKRSAHKWRPATDVYETTTAYRVVVEIAGMRGADFSVTYERNTLLIRGERREADAHQAYHQMEIDYGTFETAVQLPAPVKSGEIEASYADGFLRVTLPKAESTRVEIDEHE